MIYDVCHMCVLAREHTIGLGNGFFWENFYLYTRKHLDSRSEYNENQSNGFMDQ